VNRLPAVRVGVGAAPNVMTAQNAFSGAVLLGIVGAVYGALRAPRAYRSDDAMRYGILGAAVGGVGAVLLTTPSSSSTVTTG